MKNYNLVLVVFIFALFTGCGNDVAGVPDDSETIVSNIIDTLEIEIGVKAGDTIYMVEGVEYKAQHDTIFVIQPVHDTVLDIRYHDKYITVHDTLWDTLNMEKYMEWVQTTEMSPGMCSNDIDDDGDGMIDCEDIDCEGITYCDTLSVQGK